MSSTVLDRPIGLVHARALELLDQLDAVIDGLHELELTALTGEGAAWARDARDLVPRRSLSTGEELPRTCRRCQRRSRTAGSALCTPG